MSRSANASCSENGRYLEVKIDEHEYLIMDESDIMGVMVDVEAKKKVA